MGERIKAIETEYEGYKFRSRLEARWAVFFDACGVDWDYEPEGFDLPNGQKYLPDFLLHGAGGRAPSDLYVEVKGTMTKDDADKIMCFCSPTGGLSGEGIENPILIVGDIPRGENIEDIMEYCSDVGYAGFSGPQKEPYPFNFETIDGDYFVAYPGINRRGMFELFGDDSNYTREMNNDATLEAYKIARQARFEHGETPTSPEVRKAMRNAGHRIKPPAWQRSEGRRKSSPLVINGVEYATDTDARWGLLFELMGISYQYQPQGHEPCNQNVSPTFVIDVASGRDSGRHFVFVKRDVHSREYDADRLTDRSLVCNNDFLSEDINGRHSLSATEKDRLRHCKYYVTDICRLGYGGRMEDKFTAATNLHEESIDCGEAVFGFDSLDGDAYPALLGIGENGTAEFYGPGWYFDCENPMSEKKTSNAYLYATTQGLSCTFTKHDLALMRDFLD